MSKTTKKQGLSGNILLIVGLLLGLSGIFFALKPEASSKLLHQANFKLTVSSKVREHFKDPESAKFRDIKYGSSWIDGDVYYGEVSAKNSFGAYVGYKKFIFSDKGLLLEGTDIEFDKSWLSIKD